MTSDSSVVGVAVLDGVLHGGQEPAAVGQPRERVVARLPGEAVVELLAVGDVGHRAHHGGVVGALGVTERTRAHRQPLVLAVLVAHADDDVGGGLVPSQGDGEGQGLGGEGRCRPRARPAGRR